MYESLILLFLIIYLILFIIPFVKLSLRIVSIFVLFVKYSLKILIFSSCYMEIEPFFLYPERIQ